MQIAWREPNSLGCVTHSNKEINMPGLSHSTLKVLSHLLNTCFFWTLNVSPDLLWLHPWLKAASERQKRQNRTSFEPSDFIYTCSKITLAGQSVCSLIKMTILEW